jgi:hypothetical protein
MSAKSNYLENKFTDAFWRGQAYTMPATHYFALFRATAGISPRTTAVTLGQTTVPAVHNGRMYKCTTAGTTGGTEPTWPVVDGGTVVDGTVTWTEMRADFDSMSADLIATEVSGGSYARASIAASLANFAGTQSAGSTTASTGTSGTTSNNVAITFTTPTSNWGVIAAIYDMDAPTSGNPLIHTVLTLPQTVNNGQIAPSFAAAAFTSTES